MNERSLQYSVARYLRSQGLFVAHVKNEEPSSRRRIENSRMGILPGMPDFVIFDLQIALELKSKTGRLSASQKRILERFRSIGWTVGVCRSVEEVAELIRRQQTGSH